MKHYILIGSSILLGLTSTPPNTNSLGDRSQWGSETLKDAVRSALGGFYVSGKSTTGADRSTTTNRTATFPEI
jgi:hypothetical protein